MRMIGRSTLAVKRSYQRRTRPGPFYGGRSSGCAGSCAILPCAGHEVAINRHE